MCYIGLNEIPVSITNKMDVTNIFDILQSSMKIWDLNFLKALGMGTKWAERKQK